MYQNFCPFFQKKVNFNQKKGFSLIEIVVVLALAGFLFFILSGIPSIFKLTTSSNYLSLAKEAADRKMEEVRSEGYDALSVGTTTFTDSKIQTLPQVSATLKVEECPQEICTNSENILQVSIAISWTQDGQQKAFNTSTLIAKGGLQ